MCSSGGGLLSQHQSLSVCMTPSSGHVGPPSSPSAFVPSQTIANGESLSNELKRSSPDLSKAIVQPEQMSRKSIDMFGQHTSIYRGVTKHRWTGSYEAHLWDNSWRREGQTRKGRQGRESGYLRESGLRTRSSTSFRRRLIFHSCSSCYGLVSLPSVSGSEVSFILLFMKKLEEMKNMTRQEFVASLRRNSSGFSRSASKYRGVTRHHQHGRWQTRIGRVAGNKDLYLGTFSTQEEAAEAYDTAAIKFRVVNAVTNFDMSRYDIGKICSINNLPINALGKRIKNEPSDLSIDGRPAGYAGAFVAARGPQEWELLGYTQQPAAYHQAFEQRLWGKQEQEGSLKLDPYSIQTSQHKSLQSGLSSQALGGHMQMHNLLNLQDVSGTQALDMTGNMFTAGGNIFSSLTSNNNLLGSSAGMFGSSFNQLTDVQRYGTSEGYGNWMVPAQSISTRPSSLAVWHAPLFASCNES
ncbi:hypothetical protein KP509_10G056100 [Ceratopteris richardii]|uniref:AP2/ERF domain-containing protein n=1 Tax=Ceratopteris richardii TaxID=49495 RepID=A0A8T2TZ88_CERRI|nr:hypothetical protein KP509_10G056100 [Ceratopteris richardii]